MTSDRITLYVRLLLILETLRICLLSFFVTRIFLSLENGLILVKLSLDICEYIDKSIKFYKFNKGKIPLIFF